jgi:hypothetical protein
MRLTNIGLEKFETRALIEADFRRRAEQAIDAETS